MMETRRRLTMTALLAAALAWGGTAAAHQNMIHGQPDFDSGWRTLGGTPLQITHGLGGDPSAYVVDLQLREEPGAASAGVNNQWLGGNRFGSGAGDDDGVWIHQLDADDVWIVHGAASDTAQVRVRLWRAPTPAWSSGWQAVAAGGSLTFNHNLGGDPDDYVVDLMMRNGATIHQRGLGGDALAGESPRGAFWYHLTDSSVSIHRNAADTDAPELLMRIFRAPAPDYDSGWQAVTAGAGVTLDHALGGPWNDLYVDLQLKDDGGPWGVHAWGLGGDYSGTTLTGASWWGLTGSRIHLWRCPDDDIADRLRVRIWASRAPAYDSGWTAVPAPGTHFLPHHLGGDSDAYVVDLQLRDTDLSPAIGVNSRGYGGDNYYDFAASEDLGLGVGWSQLTSDTINVTRFPNDVTAEETRIRIWQAAPPDYDSGWTSVAQGAAVTLDHGVGGVATNMVVDLQYRSPVANVSQAAYGADQRFDTGTSAYAVRGAAWRDLTSSTVEVYRYPQDIYAEEVRVRIWRNTAWDKAHTRLNAPEGVYVYNHALDVDPDQLVVYLWAHSDTAANGYHQLRLGGDTTYFGGLQVFGFWWQNLTATGISLVRAADDSETDDYHLRLWWTGEPAEIFADGFESGGTTAWSATTP